MAKQTQLRRGSTTEHNGFIGAVGEVTVDTTKDVVVVHDGSTLGGHPGARQADITAANTQISSLFANVGLLRIDLNSLDPAGATSSISSLRANVAAANVQIANLNANATVQGVQIVGLTSDLAGANGAIQAVEIRTTVTESDIVELQAASIGTNAAIVSVEGLVLSNGAAQAQSIDALRANITAANALILTNTNRVTAANVEIAALRANITAANAAITSLTANAATQAELINSFNANVTAANATISSLTSSTNANAATQTAELAGLRANITAANATITTNQDTVLSNLAARVNESAALRANITAANASIVSANSALKNYLDDRFTNLIGAAPGALDTLQELAESLGNNASLSSTLVTSIAGVQANVTAANAAIVVNTARVDAANAEIVIVGSRVDGANTRVTAANLSISLVNANLTAANALILTNTNRVAAANVEIAALRANITAANVQIVTLQSNVAAANTAIDSLRANVTAANAAMVSTTDAVHASANAQVAAANVEISSLQSNVAAANAYIAAVEASIGTAENLDQIRANITAANLNISQLQSNVDYITANVRSNGAVFASNVDAVNFNASGNVLLRSTNNPTVRFTRTPDTTVTTGEIYGNIEWTGEDASNNAANVRARISTVATDAGGGAQINFYAADNSTTISGTPILQVGAGNLRAAGIQSTIYNGLIGSIQNFAYLTPTIALTGAFEAYSNSGAVLQADGVAYRVRAKQEEFEETIAQGKLTLNSSSLWANISLAANVLNTLNGALISNGGDRYQTDLEIHIQALYIQDVNVSPPTVKRLRKQWVATVSQSTSSGLWTINDQVLRTTVYNSDATNFAAGNVSAGKAYILVNNQVNNHDIRLRLENITGAIGANSLTTFTYTVNAKTFFVY
jgi:predicted  nucleic acid-binding Zn-ribbon protein